MATLYSKERSKYGNLTGQIIVWPVQINNDLNNVDNIKHLPSGYLRCDGAIYNVVDYPQLAAICGVGETGRFVRKNIAGTALQSLTNDQFVVPDLSSKYPKPTPGADAGQYKSIRVTNAVGNEVNRSGIGIEATSTLGTSIQVTYSGSFTVPTQTIPLRGKPGWTWGTTSGKRTESEIVDNAAIAGHMHFSSLKRTRIKSTTEVDVTSPTTQKEPVAIGLLNWWNASTVPIQDWMDNTTTDGTSSTWPGNNQPPCRAIASNVWAIAKQYQWGDYAGTGLVSNPTGYSNACWNDRTPTLAASWQYHCLMNDDWDNFPINTTLRLNGMKGSSESGGQVLGVCVHFEDKDYDDAEDVPAKYISGATGVPLDWRDNSLADVVPLNSNTQTPGNDLNPVLFNNMTDTTDLGAATDRTNHFHKVNLTGKDTHSFALVTNALELNPDSLKTTLTLSVDNAASVDSALSPFIILEYLIKI